MNESRGGRSAFLYCYLPQLRYSLPLALRGECYSMLIVGDVVEAEVTNVQVFGIFCRHRDEDLLVLIPETSWIASACSCQQFAQSGDMLTVKILNIDPESGKIAATIKGRHPNPWETDKLNAGRRHTAQIVRYVEKSDRCHDQPAFLIELLPGAFAMLCHTQRSFKPGDHVEVIIRSSDPRKRAVEVTLANAS